ncbi:MAG: DUF429 domain-containing protein [Gaiellaceae bacterium]
MTLVCGVDVGSFQTPAYVAWLDGLVFESEAYLPSAEQPLPRRYEPTAYALDAPQSLPRLGRSRRSADVGAKTPTSVLPTSRAGIAAMPIYRQFVEAGVEIFWSAQRSGLGAVPGLGGSGPVLLETYPRFVIRSLWPDLRPIPSKRKASRDYIDALWPRIRDLGLSGPEPRRHDEIDALLCALAAKAWTEDQAVLVGEPPELDEDEGVLREGFIVCPRGPH